MKPSDYKKNMASDLLEITISGSGPYGFRLSGGEGRPLVVNKLRKQSKACSAGLKEGDVLLGINGFSCQTMDHGSAMAILENTVDSLSLVIFRNDNHGPLLDAAYEKTSGRLRPLSPGSLPPPILLPPPPSADAGSLVIDQPTYLRRLWDNKPAHEDHPQQQPAVEAVQQAPSDQQRQYNHVAPPNDLEETLRPKFQVSTYVTPQKPWAPVSVSGGRERDEVQKPQQQPQPPAGGVDGPREGRGGGEGPFRVSRSDGKPWVWQPTEKHDFVRIYADFADQEPMPPPPTLPPANYMAAARDRTDGRGQDTSGGQDVEMIPRWALPLRSEYDWRSVYYYMTPPDGDEWEISEDGQFFIRRKKIFADSSFYDDPQHIYPTIEEQIKMARKVAQSLTSAGNVKARGQRMFMRRKEKADRWTIDTFMPPSKRGAAIPVGSFREGSTGSDLDGELLYYNPTPWVAPPRGSDVEHKQQQQPPPWMKKVEPPRPKSAPAIPAATPLVWKPTVTPSSVAAAAAAASAAVMTPTKAPSTEALYHHPKPFTPKVTGGGGLPPSLAFGLANEMRQMKGKGGKMFSKRRARAVAEERETEDHELRQVLMRRIEAEYETTDGGGQVNGSVGGAAGPRGRVVEREREVSPREPSVTRLLELIERSRGTPVNVVEATWTTDFGRDLMDKTSQNARKSSPARAVDFGSAKTKGGFRPVRFKAPPFDPTVPTVKEEVTEEGFSEF